MLRTCLAFVVTCAGAAVLFAGQAARQRGVVRASAERPRHFPHRVWAACDFEAALPDYAWFGLPEGDDIPAYPGNATSLRSQPSEHAPRVVGVNPVPGPRMGGHNFLYCRYRLSGADEAVFQYFSLTREDNNHVRATGLAQGKWSEVTLDFTRDAVRNDGSDQPFVAGERMDDLKVFVGRRGEQRPVEMLLDDVILFSNDDRLPPQPEPFPRRVIYLAAFDTGTTEQNPPEQRAARGRYKYWPGDLEILTENLPADTYWNAARAVPRRDGKGKWLRLMIDPKRPVGAHTKLRFRYHLRGRGRLTVQIFDATDNDNRHVVLGDLKQDRWTTTYVDFTRDARRNDGGATPFAAGHEVDDLFFFLDVPEGESADLLVDEVVLFDAGE